MSATGKNPFHLSPQQKMPSSPPVAVEWEQIYDMAVLMFMVYEYVQDWGHGLLADVVSGLRASQVRASNMDMLRGLQAKYPAAEVLQYYTNRADLQCVVGRNPAKQHLTVVFRGTDGFWDCLYDLWVVKKGLGGGVRVHRGFYNQLFNGGIYGKLAALLREELAARPGWEVYVCGHSLGAALSTLASYLLAQEFPQTRFRVFAFASPKCGNAAFKAAYHACANVHQYRICYGRDCVTAFPTLWYSHVGHNLWYDKDARLWHYYDRAVRNDYYLCRYYNAFDHSGQNYLDACAPTDRVVVFHLPD